MLGGICRREVSRLWIGQKNVRTFWVSSLIDNLISLHLPGFGPFGHQLGRFNSYVRAFDIVLADGTKVSVTQPEKRTSRFNNDLWHAVLGGGSGSFGIVTDITMHPVEDKNYHSFYWRKEFYVDGSTKHCFHNMLREYSALMEDEDFKNDSRWGIWMTTSGFKVLLSQVLGPLAFNWLTLEISWIAPKSSNKAVEWAEGNAVFERLLNAYTSHRTDPTCLDLSGYFDTLGEPYTSQLKSQFPDHIATADDTKTLSELHKILLIDWEAIGLESMGVPFTSSYQQGPTFPTGDELVAIWNHIYDIVPVDVSKDQRLLLSQIIVLPHASHVDKKIGQPHQNDIFGVVFDIWSFDGADYKQQQLATQELVKQAVGVDHKMFWAAYGDICLECGNGWEKYYDSLEEFNYLTKTKSCVDPEFLFNFSMAIPPMGKAAKAGKAKSEKKGKNE